MSRFTKHINKSSKYIINNYEEAEKERNQEGKLPYETKKVLVTFKYGTQIETIETIVKNEAISYEIISDDERDIPTDLPQYKKERLEKGKNFERDILILVDISLEDTVERAIDKFETYDCVKYASDNTYFESNASITTKTDGVIHKVTTNDPKFNESVAWNMKNVDVPKAWNKFNSIKYPIEIWIAVIDCGVQMNHPDLKNVMLKNDSVDVTQNNKKLINCADKESDKGQYTGPHGTRVAGIIISQANNGIYSAGISSIGSVEEHRNLFRLMAIKCDNDTGNNRHITKDKLVRAIKYATDNGAEVINLSYSAPKSDYTTSNYCEIEDAIKYAIKNDVTVVCSAGNDSSTKKRYPASLGITLNGKKNNGVIGVGATRKDGKLAEYTNESDAVEIVAPGGSNNSEYAQIYTTTPTKINSKGYTSGAYGTSYATPHVAGTIAMMKSINYNLSPAQLEQRIKERVTTSAKGRVTNKSFKVLNAGLSVHKMIEK